MGSHDQCAACPVWTGECPLCGAFHYLRNGKRSIRKARRPLDGSAIIQAWQEFTERHAGAMQDVSEQAGRLMAAGDREGLADLVNTGAGDRDKVGRRIRASLKMSGWPTNVPG